MCSINWKVIVADSDAVFTECQQQLHLRDLPAHGEEGGLTEVTIANCSGLVQGPVVTCN